VSGYKYIPLTELLTACEEAIAAVKTPLVVDRSEADNVNTFYNYRSAMMIDGKKMGLDKSMKKIPVPVIMEVGGWVVELHGVYVYMCTCAYVYVYMYMYMCVCVHMCMCF
jgi:hypothetical protein